LLPKQGKSTARKPGRRAGAKDAAPGAQAAPPAPPAVAGRTSGIEGGLIAVSEDGVLGWAWDPADPSRPVTAILTHGDDVLGSGVADIFDHDLVRHHVGPGIPAVLIKPRRPPAGELPVTLTLKDERGRTLGAPLVIDDPARLQPFLQIAERDVYEGFVDQLRDGTLSGWAWSPSAPERPVVVELFDGDTPIGRAEASLFREDLAGAGKRGGHCGFRLDLPASLLDDRAHSLRVRIANRRIELPGGAIAFGPLTASGLITEIVALRAEVARLAKLVERVASPQGELQASLVRVLSERVAAVAEVQREMVERELDALRAFVFGAATPAAARVAPDPEPALHSGLGSAEPARHGRKAKAAP